MDLLLTHGYFLSEDKTERSIMKPYPPLGILYLSSYLKQRGFNVSIFDSTFRNKSEFIHFVEQHKPTVAGVYVNLMTKRNVLEQIRFLKDRGWKVIVGGPDVPAYAEEYVRFGADAAVIGEGELTMDELLSSLLSGESLSHISGIVIRDNSGMFLKTPARTLITDLDQLPMPDRESINMTDYLKAWKIRHGMSSVSLICSRGCPFSCTWCSRSVFGETHRRRSVANVVDEIEYIRDQYKPDMLWFADDVFTINHKWFIEFYHEMKRRNIRIPFECISRADRLNEDILEKMSDIGSARIWYGSESGSQRILDAMKRNVDVAEIRTASRIARQYGIKTGLFVMLGYPGEELSDIEETAEHLKLTGADSFLTTVAYPIKGTEFYQEVAPSIDMSQKWSDYTDRELKYARRYSDRFYWFANRYLHNEVQQHLAKQHDSRIRAGWLVKFIKSKIARVGMEVTRHF